MVQTVTVDKSRRSIAEIVQLVFYSDVVYKTQAKLSSYPTPIVDHRDSVLIVRVEGHD
jgi:hypothetical protein